MHGAHRPGVCSPLARDENFGAHSRLSGKQGCAHTEHGFCYRKKIIKNLLRVALHDAMTGKSAATPGSPRRHEDENSKLHRLRRVLTRCGRGGLCVVAPLTSSLGPFPGGASLRCIVHTMNTSTASPFLRSSYTSLE